MPDRDFAPNVIDARYRIVAELGRGSMGRVLGVTDMTAGGVPRACKVLEDRGLYRRFLDEYRLLRRLSHPGFPAAYELGMDRATGQPYAVLELCDGETLEGVGPLDDAAVVPLAATLLRAADHLHRLGYVHGDLAPPNVVRLDDGSVKLLDLGAAGLCGSGAGSTSGVLRFVAPERLAGEALSPAGDLWSLGALVYQLLHGTHPWADYPARPPQLETLAQRGHRLDPWLARLLNPDPGERHPAAAAALADLESLTGEALPLVPADELAARVTQLPFVDVAGHLAAAQGQVDRARSRHEACVVTIAGTTGSGRSRLIAELGDWLTTQELGVVRERGVPGDEPGALISRLSDRLGGSVDLREGQAATLARSLLELASDGIAWLIDDVDRSDALSQEVLAAVARTLGRRPSDWPGVLLATVDGAGQTHLGPWTDDDVARLLADAFPGRRVGRRMGAPIAQRTGGIAGLIGLTLQAAARAGALTVDHAAVHVDGAALAQLALPASLEAAAEEALNALPEPARKLAALLGYAKEALPLAVVDDGALDILLAAGLGLSLRADGRRRIALVSQPVREAARRLGDAVTNHRELAERWARHGEGVRGARGAALWHALKAGQHAAVPLASKALGELPVRESAPLIEPLMALGWPEDAPAALVGADTAAACGLTEVAETLYRRCEELAGDGAVTAKALARLGALEARLARHAKARETLRQALTRGGMALGDDARVEILAGLARSAVLSGALDEASDAVDEALPMSADLAMRGRLRYSRGLVAFYRGDLDAATSDFEAALRDVREAADSVEEGAVVTALGLVAHRRGALDEAVDRYRAALKLGEETGDDARVLTALQNLGVVHHERGAWTEALDTYNEALGLAEALDQPGRVIQLAGNLGNLWRYLGELGEARVILERGLTLARAEGNRFMAGILLTLMGEVELLSEAWDDAAALLNEAVSACQETQSLTEETEARLDRTRLHLERREYRPAWAAAEAALQTADRGGNEGLATQARALMAAATWRSVHGDPEEAARLLHDALAGVAGITNPDARWPVVMEAGCFAAAQDDLETASRRADEVRQILQALEDAVPAQHRAAFRALRDRRRARAWAAQLVPRRGEASEGSPGGDGRWTRLLEVNKRLNTEHDVRRLLEYIMDSAILLTGAERGFLLLADDAESDTAKLDIRVARNIDQENIRNTRFKISHSIARKVIADGHLVLTVDAMEDSRYSEQLSVHDLRLRSVLCLPLTFRGNVLGAIYLDNRFRASAFDESDLSFMEAFADQAGIALNNARLLEAQGASAKALRRAREEVEALNQKLESRLEARERELEDTHRVVIRQQQQLEAKHAYSSIIGTSTALRRVFAIMDRLLDNDIPVLIEGESGTGKELVARAIHFNGTRRDRPFVAVNCGAIPENLLESELFGHVRGAFTGATSDKKGIFEAAHQGTLLLDELGELPLEMQVKLLRVLQEGEIKKVGSTRTIQVDCRILAATNRRLEAEVKAGRFREDLYYRLSVVPIQLPSLRERREDIPLLVQHFLAANRASGLTRVSSVAPGALGLLKRYSWPGNIRQLEMVLKNASLFAEGDVLAPSDFESFPDIVGMDRTPVAQAALSGRSLSEIEREAIIQALRENRGNKKRTAEQLGIDRRTLYNKLKVYKIVIEKGLQVT